MEFGSLAEIGSLGEIDSLAKTKSLSETSFCFAMAMEGREGGIIDGSVDVDVAAFGWSIMCPNDYQL